MLANIIVGIIFAAVVLIAFNKVRKDAKNNTCAGCGGGCSNKSKCGKIS